MKLYISDLDGTLLDENMSLSKETVEILNDLISKGLNFSFATARSMDSVEKIIKPLNLNLPFVLYNGVVVYNPLNKEFIRANLMEKQLVENFLQDISHLNPFVFVMDLSGINHIYYENVINEGQFSFMNAPVNKGDKRFKKINSYRELNFEKYVSVALIHKKEILEPFYQKYKNTLELEVHLTEDVYQKEYYWLEFSKKGSTKKEALIFLKNYLEANHLVTFGDNVNDISMFTIADESYAVENAHTDLKNIATGIIGVNTENSVAKKIKKSFEKD